MRKGLMLTSVAGALSMIFGGAALAASHTPDTGGWGVAAGVISTPDYCSAAASIYSCSVVASGPGFMQLQVGIKADKIATGQPLKDGEYFIQTIVTDQGVTGTANSLGFQDVSFIKMSLSLGGQQNLTQNGIFGEQKIKEDKTGLAGNATEKFTSNTTVATGWGQPSTGGPSVIISQGINSQGGNTATQSDDFVAGFKYEATVDQATGVRNGLTMDISQTVGLAAPKGKLGDIQAFALRERQGTYNPTASTTGVKANNTDPAVTWVAKDDIKAIWIGQNIDLSTDLGGTTGGGSVALGSSFGYLSFENKDALAGASNKLSSGFGFDKSNAASAWAWDAAAFGGKPVICTPDALVSSCPP